MNVPNADQAIVAQEKIVGYLLKPTHPIGGPKSVFFRAFGFSAEDWETMAEALRLHVRSHDVVNIRPTVRATSYAVVDPLQTPDGRNPMVLTAWYIRDDETVPRISAARPA